MRRAESYQRNELELFADGAKLHAGYIIHAESCRIPRKAVNEHFDGVGNILQSSPVEVPPAQLLFPPYTR